MVAVEVAEGDPEYTVAQHVGEGMLGATAEGGVGEVGDAGGGVAERPVEFPEQAAPFAHSACNRR